MPTIEMLSIDGGGMRGIIRAIVLDPMTARLGGDLWNRFDLIACTSTGVSRLSPFVSCHLPLVTRHFVQLLEEEANRTCWTRPE